MSVDVTIDDLTDEPNPVDPRIEITENTGGPPRNSRRTNLENAKKFIPQAYQFAVTPKNTDLTVVDITDDEFRVSFDMNITELQAYVTTAPVGDDIDVDIKKNGVALGTVTITDGLKTGFLIISSTELLSSDVLTVEITKIGSTTPGQNLKCGVVGVQK